MLVRVMEMKHATLPPMTTDQLLTTIEGLTALQNTCKAFDSQWLAIHKVKMVIAERLGWHNVTEAK